MKKRGKRGRFEKTGSYNKCLGCGVDVWSTASEARKYCSHICYTNTARGKRKKCDGVKFDVAGYKLIRVDAHRFSSKDNYVSEHRLVMEKELGVTINPHTHVVHHKDEDVTNNEVSNLVVLTHSEHRRIHAGWWRDEEGEWWKRCKSCEKDLMVKGNYYESFSKGYYHYTGRCKPCESAYISKRAREKTKSKDL